VLDHYSKFVFLKAVKKFTAEVVINYLQQDLYHTFGVPDFSEITEGIFYFQHFDRCLFAQVKRIGEG